MLEVFKFKQASINLKVRIHKLVIKLKLVCAGKVWLLININIKLIKIIA